MRKEQLSLSVQRMVALEIAVCGVFNRAGRPRQIQALKCSDAEQGAMLEGNARRLLKI